MNDLYSEHVQLKQMHIQLKEMLGAFVSRLNEKIESIDNFHMLSKEIDQGLYSGFSHIVALCMILSQMDKRSLEDHRKMNILMRSLKAQGILNDDQVPLSDLLADIADVSTDEAGLIYIELGSIRSNYMADVIMGIIENYHFLPDMERKMKNKRLVVDSIILANQMNPGVKLALSELFDDFVNSKLDMFNGFVPVTSIRTNKELERAKTYYDQKRYAEALAVYTELASQEDAKAMYWIGKMYLDGEGVEQDTFKAMDWFEKSGEKGDPSAWYKLGDIYHNSKYGVKEDEDKSMEYYQKMLAVYQNRADTGDTVAMFMLGFYYDDIELIRNRSKAVEWFQKAADLGYDKAVYWLGYIYSKQQDYQKAIEWYQKAADLGNPYAMYDLGDTFAMIALGHMYTDGEGVKRNPQEAMKWYRKAAEAGDDDGMRNLGDCYRTGTGVKKDFSEAIEWYQKAVEKYNESAMHSLGKLYLEEGDSLAEHDKKKAEQLWRKSAELFGDAIDYNVYWRDEAMYYLGELYYYGKGVEQDYYEARDWYKSAADESFWDGRAMFALGFMYDFGKGGKQNYKKAKKWYKKAAERNNTDAMFAIGVMHLVERNIDKAKKWMERAAEEGHVLAMTQLSGLYTVDEDDSMAEYWEKQAAEADERFATGEEGIDGLFSLLDSLTERESAYLEKMLDAN